MNADNTNPTHPMPILGWGRQLQRVASTLTGRGGIHAILERGRKFTGACGATWNSNEVPWEYFAGIDVTPSNERVCPVCAFYALTHFRSNIRAVFVGICERSLAYATANAPDNTSIAINPPATVQ